MKTTRLNKNQIANIRTSTAGLAGRTPEERSAMDAAGRRLVREQGRTSEGAGTRACDAQGVPRGLPLRRTDGRKFSEVYSPAMCERLKRNTLGRSLVFDRADF
jgi:Arc/MetJ family transcription regulator